MDDATPREAGNADAAADERLDDLEEAIDEAQEDADDVLRPFDKGPRFVDTGELSDHDDQTIAPP